MIRIALCITLFSATASGETIATSSGNAMYTGPESPDSNPHPFALEALFSPDFQSATVKLTGDTVANWSMTWVGMDEATRRFYAADAADAQLILTGSDFDMITDTASFNDLVSDMGFEYFDPAYNQGNLTTVLAGSGPATAEDVPEPAGVLLLVTGLAVLCAPWRR